MAGADAGSEAGDVGEPGFGEVAAGTAALPDMRDTLPTFEDSYGEDGGDGDADSEHGGGVDGRVDGEGASDGMATGGGADTGAGASAGGTMPSGPGTRADGGLEPFPGGGGVLTAEEQVAILDGQLEQSTSDFDGMILEEQARQREATRERANQDPREQPEPAGPGTAGRNPYEEDVAMGGGAGGGSVGGGMGGVGRSTTPPDNPAIYAPPEDIPDGRDDDVVARQLREAAMREPDPEIRERLWAEYRKYKGIESPTP